MIAKDKPLTIYHGAHRFAEIPHACDGCAEQAVGRAEPPAEPERPAITGQALPCEWCDGEEWMPPVWMWTGNPQYQGWWHHHAIRAGARRCNRMRTAPPPGVPPADPPAPPRVSSQPHPRDDQRLLDVMKEAQRVLAEFRDLYVRGNQIQPPIRAQNVLRADAALERLRKAINEEQLRFALAEEHD